MWQGRNVEKTTWAKFNHGPIGKRYHRQSGDDHADMLNFTEWRSRQAADMFGPFPSGFVGSFADRHSPQSDNLEFAFLKNPRLIGSLKPLQDYFIHSLIVGSQSAVRQRRRRLFAKATLPSHSQRHARRKLHLHKFPGSDRRLLRLSAKPTGL